MGQAASGSATRSKEEIPPTPCLRCWLLDIKCDGVIPCSQCPRRGDVALCTDGPPGLEQRGVMMAGSSRDTQVNRQPVGQEPDDSEMNKDSEDRPASPSQPPSPTPVSLTQPFTNHYPPGTNSFPQPGDHSPSESTAKRIDGSPSARRKSCAECRRLKIKCDSQVPCSSCQRRGASCIRPKGQIISRESHYLPNQLRNPGLGQWDHVAGAPLNDLQVNRQPFGQNSFDFIGQMYSDPPPRRDNSPASEGSVSSQRSKYPYLAQLGINSQYQDSRIAYDSSSLRGRSRFSGRIHRTSVDDRHPGHRHSSVSPGRSQNLDLQTEYRLRASSQSPSPNEISPSRSCYSHQSSCGASSAESLRSAPASLPPRNRMHNRRKMARELTTVDLEREESRNTTSLSLDSLPSYQDQKPPYSYHVLILLAIQGSPEKRLLWTEICSEIENKFPWYRDSAPRHWKTDVDLALIFSDIFCTEETAGDHTFGDAPSWCVASRIKVPTQSFNRNYRDLRLSMDRELSQILAAHRERTSTLHTIYMETVHHSGPLSLTLPPPLVPIGTSHEFAFTSARPESEDEGGNSSGSGSGEFNFAQSRSSGSPTSNTSLHGFMRRSGSISPIYLSPATR